jgi:hypothetical protein
MVGRGRGKRGAKSGRGAYNSTGNAKRSLTQIVEADDEKENAVTNDNDNMLHLLTQAAETSRYQVTKMMSYHLKSQMIYLSVLERYQHLRENPIP